MYSTYFVPAFNAEMTLGTRAKTLKTLQSISTVLEYYEISTGFLSC